MLVVSNFYSVSQDFSPQECIDICHTCFLRVVKAFQNLSVKLLLCNRSSFKLQSRNQLSWIKNVNQIGRCSLVHAPHRYLSVIWLNLSYKILINQIFIQGRYIKGLERKFNVDLLNLPNGETSFSMVRSHNVLYPTSSVPNCENPKFSQSVVCQTYCQTKFE